MSTPDSAAPATANASVIPTLKGLPWWAAVLLGLLPAAIGAFINISGSDGQLEGSTLGAAFQILSIAGCVLAALATRRGSIFTPMVQGPLVIIVGLTLALLLSSNVKLSILSSATVYVATFPTMAIATGAALVIGVIRIFVQPLRSTATSTPVTPQHV
ncbi:hypothetical protein D1871_21385 [Nakamurella silvestris]|nr:hypothetical protein D1871_21385 [Nakamurella silvestris]